MFFADTIKGVLEVGFVAPDIVLSTVILLVEIAVITPASLGALSKDFLPEHGVGGLLILDSETPVCAGFIYLTNSKISWVNWIVSNKNYKNKKRSKAIITLLKGLINIAINSNSHYVFANNNNNSLISKFVNLGFTKGSSSTELIYKI